MMDGCPFFCDWVAGFLLRMAVEMRPSFVGVVNFTDCAHVSVTSMFSLGLECFEMFRLFYFNNCCVLVLSLLDEIAGFSDPQIRTMLLGLEI